MSYDPDDFFAMDADMEQAGLEAAGNAAARRYRRMRLLRAAGKLAEAAQVCPHGGGYPLKSLAAINRKDPHADEAGWRCMECGSRLDLEPWGGGRVIVPCENNP